MVEKAISSLGNGEYRILFGQPIKFGPTFLSSISSLHLRVVYAGGDSGFALGIEGKKVPLLIWLESLGSVNKSNLKSYEDSMSD